MQTKRDKEIIENLEDAAPMIRNLAYSCHSDYEDLYQVAAETTISVYDRAQQAANPGGYIHRAIRFAILQYTGASDRAHRKHTLADHYLISSLDAPLTNDGGSFSLYDVTATASRGANAERDFRWLYAVLEKLPAIYQEVLCMHYGLAGYGPHTIGDIARTLGIPKGTVSCRLHKAKTMLREYSELLDLVESQTSK